MNQIRVSRSLKLTPDASRAIKTIIARAARVGQQIVSSQPDAELSIVLSDDAQIQELNYQYLGLDATTDVLSFPSGEIDPESGHTYLGDILISYPRAVLQADAAGHPLEAEIQLLVVHGVLHLCGYDHGDVAAKTKMWELQADILQKLGCPILGPPDDMGQQIQE
jgi:probable rRNA maturation factor